MHEAFCACDKRTENQATEKIYPGKGLTTLFNSSFIDPSQIRILVSVAIAMVLGAIIGLEREIADKPAGLRTHIIVAGGVTLLVSLSEVIVRYIILREGADNIQVDPVRIIEAIITGISFIGAGTIIRSRQDGSVEGITTAASILFVAGIGIAVALNQFVLAVGGTLLDLVSLRIIKWISLRLTNSKP